LSAAIRKRINDFNMAFLARSLVENPSLQLLHLPWCHLSIHTIEAIADAKKKKWIRGHKKTINLYQIVRKKLALLGKISAATETTPVTRTC
jgi:hypothetical protein